MADLYVTTTAASGDGSFSAIVSSSVNKDKIYFDESIFTDGKTVIESSGNQVYGKDNFFIVDDDKEVTFDAKGANRFMTVTNGSVVEINNSRFINGNLINNGGAIQVTGKAGFRVFDSTFENNVSTNVGGAVYVGSSGANFSGIRFLNNHTKMGGAIYAECGITIANSYFSGNTATYNGAAGGAIQFAGSGASNITDTYFTGNTGKNGGTIAVSHASANVTFTGSTFKENTATNVGGAIYVNKGTVLLNNSLFNANNQGALYLDGASASAVINGSTFATAKDTVTNGGGNLTFSGNVLLGANVSGAGSYTVTDAAFTFINSETISVTALDENGMTGVTFANTAQVNLSSWDLSGTKVAVDAQILPFGGNITIATGLTLSSDQTVNIGGADVALNSTFANGDYKLTYSDATLGVQSLFAVVSSTAGSGDGSLKAACQSGLSNVRFADSLFTDGQATVTGQENALDNKGEITINTAADCQVTVDAQNKDRCFSLLNGSVVNFNGISFINSKVGDTGGAISARNNGTELNVSGGSFADNTAASEGGAIYLNAYATAGFENVKFTQNSSGRGAAISVVGDAKLTVSNSEFAHNTATGSNTNSSGGAAIFIGIADVTLTNTKFSYNTSLHGGALFVGSGISVTDCVFTGNTATFNGYAGGAIYFTNGTSTITDTYFTGNTGKNGGTIAVRNSSASVNADITFTGSTFKENIATNVGGAIYVDSGKVTLDDTLFDSNVKGALYLDGSDAVAVINGSTFATAKDTVTNGGGNLTFTGNVLLGANVSGKGSYTVTGAEFTFINSGTISIVDMGDESGIASVAFNGAQVNFSAWDLSNVAISATVSGAAVLATGVTLKDSQTVKINGTDVVLNESFGNGIYKLNYSGNTLSVSVEAAEVTSALADGDGSLQQAIATAKDNDYAKIVFADALFADGKAVLSADESTLSAFTDGVAIAAEGGKEVILDAAESNRIAYISANSEINYKNVSFANGSTTDSYISGGAVYLNGATATFNGGSFTGNNAKSNGGAVWVHNSSNSSPIIPQAVFDGVEFINNTSGNAGGAIYVQRGSATVNNSYFSDNKSRLGGAIYVDSGCSVTINSAIFATATDTVHNSGTLTFAGSITLNSALTGNGTYIISKDTVFVNAVDLSKLNISVNSADWAGSDTVIATGVSGLGAYTTGADNLFLTLENGSLILRESNISSGKLDKFEGNGSTLMTGGEVTGAFIAQKTSSANTIATTINGGSLETNTIAGAFAKAEDGVAEIGNTELNIGGEADVKGQVYAGGYFYGTGTESTEVQMTVSKVNIKLDGNAKVNGNLFAGIHARAAANVKVNEISISINGGEHDRVYAGGWAEGNAKSTVGASTVTVDGGKVNFIYGGGANGQGETYVGATTITVGANAEVGTIFMSGRYGYSSTGAVELNWYGTSDMKRLSGVSSAGVDNADSTTVNLFSSLTADGIDYVDKFVLAEGVKLTANVEFLLGNRVNGESSGATIFDFTTDGLDGAWDAIAGISDFEHALFSVNGGEAVAWGEEDTLTLGSYTLTRTEESKDKYSISIA